VNVAKLGTARGKFNLERGEGIKREKDIETKRLRDVNKNPEQSRLAQIVTQ
jgi:hypothetical protein